MQPEIGMRVTLRNAPGGVYTIREFLKVHDPLTGQIRNAFCLDVSDAIYFADQFPERFLVVLPWDGNTEPAP